MSDYYRQTILSDLNRTDGHDSDGNPGDCWRTCIANVLGLEPTDVPNFVERYSWMDAARLWLADRLVDYGQLHEGTEWLAEHRDDFPVEQLLIVTGQSPRGDWLHCVLMDRDLQLVHDPHPSGEGIADVRVIELIVERFLMPRPRMLALTTSDSRS